MTLMRAKSLLLMLAGTYPFVPRSGEADIISKHDNRHMCIAENRVPKAILCFCQDCRGEDQFHYPRCTQYCFRWGFNMPSASRSDLCWSRLGRITAWTGQHILRRENLDRKSPFSFQCQIRVTSGFLDQGSWYLEAIKAPG